MNLRENISAVVFTLLLIVTTGGIAVAAGPEASDDLKEIKKELVEIKRELSEIKRFLRQRPAARAPLNATANIKEDPYLGSNDAKLVLVEYTDYQCPFCKRHLNNTMVELKKEYVDKGKLKYVLKDFPLPSHKLAKKGAEATHCAGDQGKFWEMHGLIFENQRRMTTADLIGYAKTLKLDNGKFKACLDSGRHAKGIEKDLVQAKKGGVTGTPSFILGTVKNGIVSGIVIKGAQPYPVFKAEIEAMLKQLSKKK